MLRRTFNASAGLSMLVMLVQNFYNAIGCAHVNALDLIILMLMVVVVVIVTMMMVLM